MSDGRTRPRTLVLSGLLGVMLITGAWMLQRAAVQAAPATVNGPKLFDEVQQLVRDQYVDTLSDSHIYRMATQGMLAELPDPYDAYLTPARLAGLNERTTGSYAGVGLQVDLRDGALLVVNPVAGGPGERAGILTGDRIAQIDGKSAADLTPEEAQRLLRGPPGSAVKLTIQRPGALAPIEVTVTRAPIRQSAVRHAALLSARVGYVAIGTFSDSTARDVARAVDSLVHAGATSLVLDLRSSPGGLLAQGVSVAELFLDRGARIVSVRGRDPAQNETFNATTGQRWPRLTLAVLVDDKTASAAEVVAGALQDHDRAVLLGHTTFGKGSVQHVFPVPAGGAVRLTTARWVTPVGRSIARTDSSEDGDVPTDSAGRPKFTTDDGRTVFGGGGVTPDVVVGDTTPSVENLAFLHALGSHVADFHDALTSMALAEKARHAIASPAFSVTPAMLDTVYRRMQLRGATVPRPVYDAASSLVSRLLAYEIDRYVFGADAELRRRAADDRPLVAAERLLTASRTQRDVLRQAATVPSAAARE